MRLFWQSILALSLALTPALASAADAGDEHSAEGKAAPPGTAPGSTESARGPGAVANPDLSALELEIEQLRELLAGQSRQLQEQSEQLQRQQQTMEQLAERLQALSAGRDAAVALPAVLQLGAKAGAISAGQVMAQPVSLQTPAQGPPSTDLTELSRTTADLSRSIAGFRFSGDFRFRLDAQLRPGNDVAGPLQNVRSRYRLRLNVDKTLNPRFGFHMQLSTAPFNNIITNDQDMAGVNAKHPLTISEAYIDYRPTSNLQLRGGRMSEIFADNMRFTWDDDVRFNGFHQTLTIPLQAGLLGFRRLELRSAEYYLTNPNIAILPTNSPFVAAGYQPGQKVRDAMLFHPGFVLTGDPQANWRHSVTSDIQLYRNPNQIQLAATAAGFPVTVSNALGLALSGPIGSTGNATTTAGGAQYFARHFQIAHLAYRIERRSLPLFGRSIPAWLDVQVSRNVGTSTLRDAFMISGNVGEVTEAGNMRFLYQFGIKDANALISQFTDDDLGTGTGVNIAVHALRFDLGLARFLQWQNLVFLQTERRPSDPAAGFFVPLQRGAGLTYRYLGQLAFSF
jgi:hypothetical protein